MNGTTFIRAELLHFKQNELIFASKLYREKLSGVVEEAAYYKTLERMCQSGELMHTAKGIYNLPKKSKYGIVPPSDEEIINAFTQGCTGTVIGDYLYNTLCLTTQITKTIHILSSVPEGSSKTVSNVVVHKALLVFDKDVENMVHGLDILQNLDTIQDLNYKSFIDFSRHFAERYIDTVFEQVISAVKIKKSTMSFLRDILTYYGVSNKLDRHLSSMSKYKHPLMEEIIKTAQG